MNKGSMLLEILGVISLAVAYVSISLAISNAPWFTWTGNALSDLGVHTGSDLFFNGGLILAGSLFVVYIIYILSIDNVLRQPISVLGITFLALSGIFLALVGVFTEHAGELHFYVAVGFFLCFPIGALLTSIGVWGNTEDKLLIILAVLDLLVFFSIFIIPWRAIGVTGLAIPEILLALADTIWLVYFTYIRLRG